MKLTVKLTKERQELKGRPAVDEVIDGLIGQSDDIAELVVLKVMGDGRRVCRTTMSTARTVATLDRAKFRAQMSLYSGGR